jgi:hypothetical protein
MFISCGVIIETISCHPRLRLTLRMLSAHSTEDRTYSIYCIYSFYIDVIYKYS